MKALSIFLIAFAALFSAQAQCPSWQTNLHQFGPTGYHFKDINTAETLSGNGDFIVTGTRFNSTFTTEELFVAKISGADGSRQWVNTYTNVQSARGFDVTVFIDATGVEKLAITGYINDGGPLKKAYIAVMDTANGALISDEAYTINPNFHSQGLNIIYTERDFNGAVTPGFVVAGYTTGNYDPLVAGNTEGFLLRTDLNLNPLFTSIISSPTSASSDFDMANEVIETSDGFFVTGSINEDAGIRQGVLVMKFNDQGAIAWQNSYIYGNDRDKGIDAFYDATTNQIYLLTYYSVNHYFGFTVINNGNGAINPVRSYAYVNGSELNRTGFKIMPSNNASFPNDIIILGYERDGIIQEPNGTTGTGNSVPFSISLDRLTGAVNRFRFYPVPYQDPTNYNDNFRFWDGQSPLIYHPEIGFPMAFGHCYVMVGNRSYGSSRTAIETFTLDTDQNNVCEQEDITVSLVNFQITPEIATITTSTSTTSPLTLMAQGNGSETQGCTEGGTLAILEFDTPSINVFPNPSSEILRVGNLATTIARYRIIDISGKIIQQAAITENKININTLSAGVYFLEISEKNKTTTLKFIKN